MRGAEQVKQVRCAKKCPVKAREREKRLVLHDYTMSSFLSDFWDFRSQKSLLYDSLTVDNKKERNGMKANSTWSSSLPPKFGDGGGGGGRPIFMFPFHRQKKVAMNGQKRLLTFHVEVV